MQILLGDSLEVLKTLPDNSVQCVVTSPPYYGLRDYGTATWEGGDPDCKHYVMGDGDAGQTKAGKKQQSNRGSMRVAKDVCPHCGAVRIDNQIGLEKTPEEYVDRLVAVFREVRRVLKEDGTLWLNLGDSYVSNPGDRAKVGGFQGKASPERIAAESSMSMNKHHIGLKPKDLIGIPWRVAFALQADGWWLRQDIIWAKPNPMPESVTDRCTKAHEYIFLLSKSARYYYDYKAVQEPAAYDGRKDEQFKGAIKSYDGVMPGGQPHSFAQNGHPRWNKNDNGDRVRNKRSVWTVSTTPYKGAHFATFPPKLIEPCILAGSRPRDVVLDPFNGSGTTGQVALENGRNYIGIELNPAYVELTYKRLANVLPKLTAPENEKQPFITGGM